MRAATRVGVIHWCLIRRSKAMHYFVDVQSLQSGYYEETHKFFGISLPQMDGKDAP